MVGEWLSDFNCRMRIVYLPLGLPATVPNRLLRSSAKTSTPFKISHLFQLFRSALTRSLTYERRIKTVNCKLNLDFANLSLCTNILLSNAWNPIFLMNKSLLFTVKTRSFFGGESWLKAIACSKVRTRAGKVSAGHSNLHTHRPDGERLTSNVGEPSQR